MARILALVTLVAVSLLPALAAAERGSGEAQCQPGQDCTEIDMGEADDILGEYITPQGDLLQIPRRGRGARLFHAREHFIPELVKSVEDI